MSRTAGSKRTRPAFILALLLGGSLAAPSSAQDAPASPASATAEDSLRDAAETYGPPDPKARETCPSPKPGDEIVVCGETEDPEKYRVKSSGDLDPTGAGAKGPPRAPDLFNLPQPAMVGVGVSAKGCFIPPCPAPMPVLIDLKALPEAPEGSDADLIGRGEKPR